MRHIFFPAFFWICFTFSAQAQEKVVVQVFGIVKSEDQKNKPLDMVTVGVKGQYRGTFTNKEGVFSLAVRAGDTISFSYVGYKPLDYVVPAVVDKHFPFHYVETIMETSNIDLPSFQVRSLPTKAQFERDFVNLPFEDDLQSNAVKNLSHQSLKQLMLTVPVDGMESLIFRTHEQENNFIYYKQLPSISIFNPIAWAQFIQQIKSGAIKFK